MRPLSKIIIWFFSITIGLLVLLFAFISFYINSFKPQIERLLTEEIGMEAKIDGKLAIKLIPDIRLVIKKVSITNYDKEFIKVSKVEASFQYNQLLSQEINIDEVFLIKPEVFITRDSIGLYNYELVSETEIVQQDTSEHSIPELSLSLDQISIEDGLFHYIDGKYGDTLLFEGVDLNSEQINFSGMLDSLNIDHLSFSGKLIVDYIKVNLLEFNESNFDVMGESGILTIKPRDSDFYGGKSTGTAILDFSSNKRKHQITLRIDDFVIEDFLKGIGQEEIMTGVVDVEFDLKFRGDSNTDIINSLTGFSKFYGKDLVYYGNDIDNIVTKFEKSQNFSLIDLGAVFVAGPFGAVFTKGMSFANLIVGDMGEKSEIKELIAHWTFSNGLVAAEDVAFSTHKNRIALVGAIDYRNKVYKEPTLAILSKEGCAVLSETENGSFENPDRKQISKVGALLGPVKNLWKKLTKPISKKCQPIYEGIISHPE
jgi:AsmA protein